MDDRELTDWLCEQLGTLDGWLWAPDAEALPSDVVGVFYGRISAAPDRAVGVRVYGGTDDRETDSKTRRVQLRSRGARGADGAEVQADAAFNHLRHLMREGVISEVIRQSFSPSGVDESARDERTDNYLIIFDNPEASS